MDLSYNHFTFNGMELIAQTFPFAKYRKQDRINVHRDNNALYVSAGGTLSNNTYRWLKVGQTDYTEIVGDSVFNPTESGTYYVKITNSAATALLLKSDSIVYTLPAVTNSNIASSANTDKENLLQVYSNPAKDILYVQTNGNASFSLVSQSGKILRTKNINGNGSFNLAGIAAGLYYLKNNSTGEMQKVVISR